MTVTVNSFWSVNSPSLARALMMYVPGFVNFAFAVALPSFTGTVAESKVTAAGPRQRSQFTRSPCRAALPRPLTTTGTLTGKSGWFGRGLRVGGVSCPIARVGGPFLGVGRPSSSTVAVKVNMLGKVTDAGTSSVIEGGRFFSDSALRAFPA